MSTRVFVFAWVSLLIFLVSFLLAFAVVRAEAATVEPQITRYWERQLSDGYEIVRCGPRACRVRVHVGILGQVLVCRWLPARKPHTRCFEVKTYPLAQPAR